MTSFQSGKPAAGAVVPVGSVAYFPSSLWKGAKRLPFHQNDPPPLARKSSNNLVVRMKLILLGRFLVLPSSTVGSPAVTHLRNLIRASSYLSQNLEKIAGNNTPALAA
jgi:hypothetical protein